MSASGPELDPRHSVLFSLKSTTLSGPQESPEDPGSHFCLQHKTSLFLQTTQAWFCSSELSPCQSCVTTSVTHRGLFPFLATYSPFTWDMWTVLDSIQSQEDER